MPRTGIPCFFLPMAAPNSIQAVFLLVLATIRTVILMLCRRPQVTFATGGYVSTPVAFASWLLRIPVVLFLPDIVPGKAVAWLAPLARRIAVSTDGAIPFLPASKVTVTGYPVRDLFREVSRTTARERFDLPANERVLCVFGGSLGARSINRAMAICLPAVLRDSFVLHISGEARLAEAQAAAAKLPVELLARYQLFPYLHDQAMADALAAADLVLCRSGASTLGELPAIGVPAILVPLPDAAVQQDENARYLASRGAAVVLDDADLARHLGPTLDELLHDPERLDRMAQSCCMLDHPQAAAAIAAVIKEVAG